MKQYPLSGARFWIVASLLLATAVFIHARRNTEVIVRRQGLQSFPARVGEWYGQELPIGDEVRHVLGDGDFIERLYKRTAPDNSPAAIATAPLASAATGNNPLIDLFIAYFPTQRTGSTIHSPKHCLPGSGWEPLQSQHVSFIADGHKLEANRYVIVKDSERQVVLYWYQAHNRAVASEYLAKLYLIADAISMNRTDGALVRLITPVEPGETTEDAELRVKRFAQEIAPDLNRYIPK